MPTTPVPRPRPRKPTLEMLPAGTRLGRYELIRRLATGGMAELYLARAGGISGFEKLVALKRILPQYAQHEDFVRMFLDEARLTATIQHANVAQVYDIGQCDDGLFFTMEFVHGADLRTVLHALARRGQAMPLADALTIAIGAAAGLHAAHERCAADGAPLGIIHRDVTPSNVLVSFEGCVKLIDFGIAKAERRTTETRAGTLKGKIAYMSPEQCLGEPLDRRSDVFSLGIVLFEASTGTRLFRTDNEFAALRQIVDEDAPSPASRRPGYPPGLEAIVMRALRRDRAERYPTALALQLDLEELARREGLAVSTAHLAAFMRVLLPERAAEPHLPPPLAALGDGLERRRLPLPPPVVVGSGTGETDALPDLADELEPSISIAVASASPAADHAAPSADSAVSSASALSAVSAVSAELALLRRQRRSHLAVALGLGMVTSAMVAIAPSRCSWPRSPAGRAAAPDRGCAAQGACDGADDRACGHPRSRYHADRARRHRPDRPPPPPPPPPSIAAATAGSAPATVADQLATAAAAPVPRPPRRRRFRARRRHRARSATAPPPLMHPGPPLRPPTPARALWPSPSARSAARARARLATTSRARAQASPAARRRTRLGATRPRAIAETTLAPHLARCRSALALVAACRDRDALPLAAAAARSPDLAATQVIAPAPTTGCASASSARARQS
ncbi:MAG: serine/threonine protein kinase [Kofleriaceae bacterium]|nr:serine/threonine protein kinase [Kofleriaceae bacterium]